MNSMKKIISIVLAIFMLFSVTSFAFAETGENVDPLYNSVARETFVYPLRNTQYGNIVGYVEVLVVFDYDGSEATIRTVTDNSYVNGDYRLTGSVQKISPTRVSVDYTCVPLTATGNAIYVDLELEARADGNLREHWNS